MTYVLDTHVLFWLLTGNEKLPLSVRERLADDHCRWVIPAMVVAEFVDLIVKGRTKVTLEELQTSLRKDARIRIEAMDEVVAYLGGSLSTLADIHDRCIVATTLCVLATERETALVTADRDIRNCGLVPVIWESNAGDV